jgi:hypothetical protein
MAVSYAIKKSFHGFFDGLQNRFAILHALSRPPWLYIPWQVRAKFPPWLYNNWQVLVKKMRICVRF